MLEPISHILKDTDNIINIYMYLYVYIKLYLYILYIYTDININISPPKKGKQNAPQTPATQLSSVDTFTF